MSDADEDDGVTHRSMAAELMSALVFGLLGAEREQGDGVVACLVSDMGHELAGDVAQERG